MTTKRLSGSCDGWSCPTWKVMRRQVRYWKRIGTNDQP